MGKRIGIFGTSGMAREARDIAAELGMEAVLVARDAGELAAYRGKDELMLESEVARFADMPYLIGVGEGAVRRRIAARYAGQLRFGNLVHPSVTFGQGQRAHLDGRRGVIACAGVRFTCGISIGDFTIFNLNATVSHDCVIGDFVTVAPQACLLGNVEVGEGAWIGAGAVVNQGSNEVRMVIGPNTVIGSGAVVVRPCEADAVYAGVPARKIK